MSSLSGNQWCSKTLYLHSYNFKSLEASVQPFDMHKSNLNFYSQRSQVQSSANALPQWLKLIVFALFSVHLTAKSINLMKTIQLCTSAAPNAFNEARLEIKIMLCFTMESRFLSPVYLVVDVVLNK